MVGGGKDDEPIVRLGIDNPVREGSRDGGTNRAPANGAGAPGKV